MRQRLLDPADTDGDGAVSKAEYDAALAKLADQDRRGRQCMRHQKRGRYDR